MTRNGDGQMSDQEHQELMRRIYPKPLDEETRITGEALDVLDLYEAKFRKKVMSVAEGIALRRKEPVTRILELDVEEAARSILLL